MPHFSLSIWSNDAFYKIQETPPQTLLAYAVFVCIYLGASVRIAHYSRSNSSLIRLKLYTLLYFVAPIPRPIRPSEKTYKTILPNGKASEARQLPCWLDDWRARKELKKDGDGSGQSYQEIEEPEIFMSVVVPAYNEEARLTGMLEEAVEFLQTHYGDAHGANVAQKTSSKVSSERKIDSSSLASNGRASNQASARGWELIIVSDGSTDKTIDIALEFAKEHQLSEYPPRKPGPWSPNPQHSTHIPHGAIRVVALEQNRGKGGAVTHGMRHVRGQYTVFADADGASKFDDLEALVLACQSVEDSEGRSVAIGSRAHLVGSEAVVKVFSSAV
jgi:dolichyl-phosphate beta-glucosyltransferase